MADSNPRPNGEQVAKWHPRLLRTALRLTGNEHDAADLTQQAFCQAMGSWEQFNGHSQPTTWLYRILINCIRQWKRRETQRSISPLDEWAIESLPDGHPGSPEVAAVSEEADRIRQAVGRLSGTLREAFVLTVIDGYRYCEAAERLEVPVGTIASRVHEARRQVMEAVRGVKGKANHERVD